AARACKRLQSRPLDENAFRDRHAARPPGLGRVRDPLRRPVEPYNRGDRSAMAPELPYDAIGTLSERVSRLCVKTPLAPRAASREAVLKVGQLSSHIGLACEDRKCLHRGTSTSAYPRRPLVVKMSTPAMANPLNAITSSNGMPRV